MIAAPFELGAIRSPIDTRDYPISAAYAAAEITPVAAPPASYVVPAPRPPILSQIGPTCVPTSSAWEQQYWDMRDQRAIYDFDEALFFRQIGGSDYGAIPRDALDRRLAYGYPVVLVGDAGGHRIGAYYAVPLNKTAIQQAIMAFGPILIATPWFNSWFSPFDNGVLPPPDRQIGGHQIVADGWDSRGLMLPNTWGTGYGVDGVCWLPWRYLGYVWEGWKATDRIETTKSILIAANAKIMVAAINTASGCISGWTTKTWGSSPSSASCTPQFTLKGCISGSAPVTQVLNGVFAGRIVRVDGTMVRVA